MPMIGNICPAQFYNNIPFNLVQSHVYQLPVKIRIKKNDDNDVCDNIWEQFSSCGLIYQMNALFIIRNKFSQQWLIKC